MKHSKSTFSGFINWRTLNSGHMNQNLMQNTKRCILMGIFGKKYAFLVVFLNEHEMIDISYIGKCYFQDIFIRTCINIIIIHWYSKCASSSFTEFWDLWQYGTWDGCDQPCIALSNQLMGSCYLYEYKYLCS